MDTSSSGRIKQRAIVTGGAFDCLISIPCFRESKRLPFFLDALCKELACAPFKASIVIVDAFIGRTYDRTVHREVFSKMDLAKGRSTYESELNIDPGSAFKFACGVTTQCVQYKWEDQIWTDSTRVERVMPALHSSTVNVTLRPPD